MGLAYEVALTPRNENHGLNHAVKKINKSKRSALLLKSFTLDRSVTRINVMQARNYLKKPYFKANNSGFVSTKESKKKNKIKEYKISVSDDLDNVEDIFEETVSIGVKKPKIKKSMSFKINKMKTPFNSEFVEMGPAEDSF